MGGWVGGSVSGSVGGWVGGRKRGPSINNLARTIMNLKFNKTAHFHKSASCIFTAGAVVFLALLPKWAEPHLGLSWL